MSTLNEMLADARKSYFGGLRETVAEQYAEFKKSLAQLNAEEREHGEPMTIFLEPGLAKTTVKPKPKPVGFANKETDMSRKALAKRYGHLVNLDGDARIQEAVKIFLANPDMNQSHLSRSLGKGPSWFGQILYRARRKGML